MTGRHAPHTQARPRARRGSVHVAPHRARTSRQQRAAARRSPRAQGSGPSRRAPRRIGILAALLIVGLIIGIIVRSCVAGDGAQSGMSSPYTWSHLSWSGDRLSYVEDGQTVSRLGVDVSDHQGYIDWEAVAADGIDFAMVRLGYRGYTEGVLNRDAYAAYNLEGAQAAGIDVGAYFFSQATTVDEAREEAAFVLGLLDGRSLEMPVAFDHEPIAGVAGRANDVDSATLAACAAAFCETLEEAGYATIVYGNDQDLARFISTDSTMLGDASSRARALSDALGGREVWFAAYGTATPQTSFVFRMWQYTNAGTVAGIDTSVDLNILLPAA